MAKDKWKRLTDTLAYISSLLGNDAMIHIQNKLPYPNSPACDQLSDRLSFGGRGLIKKNSETQRRRAKRAFCLLLILLEGRDDVYLQNQLQSIETNYNGDKVRYDTVSRTIWMRYDHTVDCKTLRSKLTNLKNNPLQFMRTYPVLPDHGRILDGSDIDYDLVTIDGTGNDTLIHRMLLTPSGANEYAFKLAYAPTSKQSQGTPIYFLPWQSARIVRMTLGAASNLFFTAAINGCSVFVEGPANAPIVYHAGINPPWPNMNNTVSAHVRRAKNANNVELTWRELFWDKSAVARNAVNFGEVNKTHYVADGTMTGGNETTARANAYHNNIRNPWRNANFDIVSCSPWGCFFGIRNTGNGNWTFYLQQNATLVYIAPDGKGYGTARLLRLTKIYPTPQQHYTPLFNANSRPNQNDLRVMPM